MGASVDLHTQQWYHSQGQIPGLQALNWKMDSHLGLPGSNPGDSLQCLHLSVSDSHSLRAILASLRLAHRHNLQDQDDSTSVI